MGVDATFYIHAPVSKETQARILWRFASVFGDKFDSFREPEDGETHTEMHFLDRYYGPGYERGHWPTLYGKLRIVQHECPGVRVSYGGDSGDVTTAEDCTPEFLTGVWSAWAAHDNQPYRYQGGEPSCCGGAMYQSWGSGGWQDYACPKCDRIVRHDRATGAEIPRPADAVNPVS